MTKEAKALIWTSIIACIMWTGLAILHLNGIA